MDLHAGREKPWNMQMCEIPPSTAPHAKHGDGLPEHAALYNNAPNEYRHATFMIIFRAPADDYAQMAKVGKGPPGPKRPVGPEVLFGPFSDSSTPKK